MFHKEVHQCSGDCGRRVKEKRRDPKNGSIQFLQAQEEVVPVLNSQQIIVVLLQDAGVKCRHVGSATNVLLKNLCGSKVASEDKVILLNLGPAERAGENATVADHSTNVVVPVEDRRDLWQERAEVLSDGVHVLVTGVVKVHQLPDFDCVSSQSEVVGHVDVMRDLCPARQC